MPAFNRILHSDIIGLVWKKVFQRLRDGKLIQLMTLKPIQVYNDKMPYDLDGAHLDVDIDARLENLIQKPIQRAFDILSMDFKSAENNKIFSYSIAVDANVKMDYHNMAIYLKNQFAHHQYWILDDKVGLTFHDFILSKKNNQLEVIIPMHIHARYRRFNYQGEAEVFARGNIVYDPINTLIKIVDISYVATSDKLLLRMANMMYYKDIVNALEEFLQFDIKDELEDGLQLLKKEVEEYNQELTLLSGEVSNLRLNYIELLDEGAHAHFQLDGRVRLLS